MVTPQVGMSVSKRVRLQYERTEKKKRCLLGAELTSRLAGRAWEVASADIDHERLQRPDGPAYLLQFLEQRLCRAPVPDTGARLEDFFVRLRQSPGCSMTEWAIQVREAYRRLQRAMARQRADVASRQPAGSSRPSSTPISNQIFIEENGFRCHHSCSRQSNPINTADW